MEVTTDAIYKVAMKNPNDFTFGEKLKNIAEARRKKSLLWGAFYLLTRGNSQELGGRIRSLVNTKRPLKSFADIIRRETVKTPHAWLKGIREWKDKVSTKDIKLQMAGGRNF